MIYSHMFIHPILRIIKCQKGNGLLASSMSGDKAPRANTYSDDRQRENKEKSKSKTKAPALYRVLIKDIANSSHLNPVVRVHTGAFLIFVERILVRMYVSAQILLWTLQKSVVTEDTGKSGGAMQT